MVQKKLILRKFSYYIFFFSITCISRYYSNWNYILKLALLMRANSVTTYIWDLRERKSSQARWCWVETSNKSKTTMRIRSNIRIYLLNEDYIQLQNTSIFTYRICRFQKFKNSILSFQIFSNEGSLFVLE